MPRARIIGSAAAMLVVAALVGKTAFGHAFGTEWSHLLLGVMLGLAGVGLTRPSLPVAVVARGAAWLVFAPTAVASVLLFAMKRHVPFEIASIAASAAVALLLSRFALHTRQARQSFAPAAFRSWLLGGSVANAAAGIASGFIAVQVARVDVLSAVVLSSLSLAFLASAIAVVRMRAWGVFLGAVTSVVLLAWGLFARGGRDLPIFAVAAAPALLMHVLPILIARFRGLPTRARETEAHFGPPTASSLRVRIADPRQAHMAKDTDTDTDTESFETVAITTTA